MPPSSPSLRRWRCRRFAVPFCCPSRLVDDVDRSWSRSGYERESRIVWLSIAREREEKRPEKEGGEQTGGLLFLLFPGGSTTATESPATMLLSLFSVLFVSSGTSIAIGVDVGGCVFSEMGRMQRGRSRFCIRLWQCCICRGRVPLYLPAPPKHVVVVRVPYALGSKPQVCGFPLVLSGRHERR